MKPAILSACLLVAAVRPVLLFVEFNPHVQSSFEAAAHLLVGGLFVGWRMGFRMRYDVAWVELAFWFLAAVEIICGIIIPLGWRLT